MARAIDPDQIIEFIEPEDVKLAPDDPFRTVWGLRHLTLGEHRDIQDQAAQVKGDDVKVNSGTVQLETLRRGIASVDNLRDPKQPCGDCGGTGEQPPREGEDWAGDAPRCATCQGAGMLCLQVETDKVGPRKGQVSDSFLRRLSVRTRQRIAARLGSEAEADETLKGES